MGDAIYSIGLHASIGPITNSGQIIGYVEIDNQASVTVRGGTGTTFGTWVGGAINGGAITVGNGNLIFASGNTDVDEDILVDGGLGTVTNDGALRFAASEVINGNFTNDGTVQVSSGKLEIDGAVTGEGKDTISGPSKLQFDAGVSTAATLGHQDIDLSGTGGTMALLEPTDFYGKISDFGSGDTVKLENSWLFSALSHASGMTTLTLESGTTKHAFEFAGDYSRSEFRITQGRSRPSHTRDGARPGDQDEFAGLAADTGMRARRRDVRRPAERYTLRLDRVASQGDACPLHMFERAIAITMADGRRCSVGMQRRLWP